MPLTIATWNINSVRLRAPLVQAFLREERPDVLCLQETKCPAGKFPSPAFEQLGYRWLVCRGDKGYNGVAILSRVPIQDAGAEADAALCRNGHARHVAARLPGGTVLHNLYIPAGGDVPDPEANEKFAHKLDFVGKLAGWGARLDDPAILVGDLNIAPLEQDVWSHRQLMRVVSHTPVEVEALLRAQAAGGWTDVTRAHVPAPEKLYSWWSYRAKDWAAADRGRRLDHIWSREVADVPGSSRILKAWRGIGQPSDHVPVLATFDIG